MFKCATSVMCSVAVLAASQWTNWCLRCCGAPASVTSDAAPINPLGSDPRSPCCGVFVDMICCCGIGEEDDNEKKWEVLRNMMLTSSYNGIHNRQCASSTHDECCCVWLHVAGVPNSTAICSKSVRCYLCVVRDKYRISTAEI